MTDPPVSLLHMLAVVCKGEIEFLTSCKQKCYNPVATQLLQWTKTGFLLFVPQPGFSEQPCLNVVNEADAESGEMTPPDVTSRAIQHSCKQSGWDAPMAHRLLIEKGENERKGERNCIYFCPWSVKDLNKYVGVVNRGRWIKCVVAWERESTYVVFVGMCAFVSLSVISQPF